MIPVKSREISDQYADSIEIPREDMWDMVCHYYGEIKKDMRGLEHYKIRINGLGYMNIRNGRVLDGIDKLEYRVFSKFYKYPKDRLIEQLDLLYRAREWNEEVKRKRTAHHEYRQHWIHEYERDKLKNETEGNTEAGMGEQAPDS